MLDTVILSTSLAIQLAAAHVAIRLIPVTGHRIAWLAIASALLLMAARRGITLFGLLQSGQRLDLVAEFVALAISALLLGGLLGIRPILESQRKANRLQSRLGRLLDNTLHEIYLFSASDLRFSQVNRGARHNLGYSLDEMLKLTPVDLKPDFDEDAFRAMIEPLLRADTDRLLFSTVHQRKDGSTYPVEVDLQVIQEEKEPVFVAIIQDETERQRAEQALEEREEHFRSLIENISDVITVIEQGGRIVYQSPSVERVLGFRPDEREGQSALQLIHPEDQKKVEDTLALLFDDKTVGKLGYRLRHKNGTWRDFEAVGRVTTSPQGKPQLIVNQRDVTERLKSDEVLRQTQTMETIGTLAGGIAHDFNNLLMPMMGFSESLRPALRSQEDIQRLEEIISATSRAQELVDQILAFSRQTKPDRRPVSASDVVNQALGLVRSSLPSNVAVETRFGPGLENILADRTQAHQVIMNLCTNAHHAMPDGGTLSVAAKNFVVTPSHADDYPNLPPGEYVRIQVSDTGHGMDARTMEHIFEPFFTTKSVDEGTGLGLAVAHGIMAEHGGELTAQSLAGEGSQFCAIFPRARQAPEPEPAVETIIPGAERVLVVDDENSVAKVLQDMLSTMGYSVVSVTDSQQALALVRDSNERFDLVITDQTMPVMTGIQIANELKSIQPDLPVLLISGYCTEIDPADYSTLGIVNRISKPIQAADLSRAVRDALALPA